MALLRDCESANMALHGYYSVEVINILMKFPAAVRNFWNNERATERFLPH